MGVPFHQQSKVNGGKKGRREKRIIRANLYLKRNTRKWKGRERETKKGSLECEAGVDDLVRMK